MKLSKIFGFVACIAVMSGCKADVTAGQEDEKKEPTLEELNKALHEGNDKPFRALKPGSAVARKTDRTGYTLLHSAVRQKNHMIAELLLKVDADPNTREKHYGRGPLHYAASESDARMIGLLLRHGAKVDLKAGDGMTPLMFSASHPVCVLSPSSKTAVENLERLIKAGADVNVSAADGQTAVHVAVRESCSDVLRTLLARNAKPDPRTKEGLSPLHLAAANGTGEHMQETFVDMVRQLVKAGADVNARLESGVFLWDVEHKKGETPLDLALKHRMKDVANELKRHGGKQGFKLSKDRSR
jgi:ankyrin repeat protein